MEPAGRISRSCACRRALASHICMRSAPRRQHLHDPGCPTVPAAIVQLSLVTHRPKAGVQHWGCPQAPRYRLRGRPILSLHRPTGHNTGHGYHEPRRVCAVPWALLSNHPILDEPVKMKRSLLGRRNGGVSHRRSGNSTFTYLASLRREEKAPDL